MHHKPRRPAPRAGGLLQLGESGPPCWLPRPQHSASRCSYQRAALATGGGAGGVEAPLVLPGPRPIPRPSGPGSAPSADRLRGAAQPAPPPRSAQAGGVAEVGRDVLVGGGPGDGIRPRRAGAQSLKCPAGGRRADPSRWVWAGEGRRSRTRVGGRRRALAPSLRRPGLGGTGRRRPGDP